MTRNSPAFATSAALITCSNEVQDALVSGAAVVALESSVLAHGLPYPANLETGALVEQAVRDSGAVPAMIAVDKGCIVVGLGDDERERLATTSGVPKVGNRDLGAILARGALGATTVAATLAAADVAGIHVLATGGLGGVHRGATETFDVSGDLLQLTRSRLAVVSAGVKSILDIDLTLEYLETLGVPVVGFGCDDFPAYYCRTSGRRVPQRLDRVDDLAATADLHWRAGLGGSLLVVAPIDERAALDSAEIDGAITAALSTASDSGVAGPALTPYLMKAISAATGGRTAAANQAVLLGSARLAGELAAAYARLRVEAAS
jgi:pseudouridylate synthase